MKATLYVPIAYCRTCGPLPLTTPSIKSYIMALQARYPIKHASMFYGAGIMVGRGSFISKEKEFVRVLGPQLRTLEGLENSHELIDVLHRVLLFWEKSQRAEMIQTLAASGYGQSEAFYRVAQAISETLPNESKEKKLLDGFLAGRERVREDVIRIAQQRGLWEE